MNYTELLKESGRGTEVFRTIMRFASGAEDIYDRSPKQFLKTVGTGATGALIGGLMKTPTRRVMNEINEYSLGNLLIPGLAEYHLARRVKYNAARAARNKLLKNVALGTGAGLGVAGLGYAAMKSKKNK